MTLCQMFLGVARKCYKEFYLISYRARIHFAILPLLWFAVVEPPVCEQQAAKREQKKQNKTTKPKPNHKKLNLENG